MARDPQFIVEGRALLARREYADVVRICRSRLLTLQTQRRSRSQSEAETETRLLLGAALAALGRWRELIAETDLLIGMAPRLVAVWRLRGQALLSAEDWSGAEQCLQRARELDPKDQATQHLFAELAIAKSASVGSFSANELTEHAGTESGTLPTAPEVVVGSRKHSLATAAQGGTLTTAVGPAPTDLGHEGHDVHTEIDVDMPSDPNLRLELLGRTPPQATNVPRGRDDHDATVPVPYADALPEERTDIRSSTRVDPLAGGGPAVQAVLKPRGGAETTVVPPALPPPPSPPPPALAANDLYGGGTRTDLDAVVGRRRRRWIILGAVALLSVAIWLVLRGSGASGAGSGGVGRDAVLQLAQRGSSASFANALALLEGDGGALVSLRARLAAEAAYWYGEPRPTNDAALVAPAAAGDLDAVDALCLIAIQRGDRPAARRYSAEHERLLGNARSRYLVGLTLLQEGKPTEAAAALRKSAEESKYPLASLAWARAEVRVGRLAEARLAFTAAETAAPDLALARIEAVRAEVRAAGPASLPAWRDRLTVPVTGSAGERARAKLVEAELAIALSDVDAARRALLAAMTTMGPHDVALGAELGAALAAVGDLDAAEPLARRAFDGGAPNGRLILADVVQRRGRFEEALTLLTGDASPEGRVARAECELGLGRPTAARTEIEGALQQSPGLVSALVVLSRIEILEGRSDEARARLERLATADATGTAAALAARLWIRAGVQERARQLVTNAVRAQPMSADVQLAVAELALASGDRTKARAALALSSRLAVGAATTRQERATVAAALGDLGNAADQLATISARAAAIEGARYRLLLGDPEQAGRELDRAATLPGTATDAESELRARWLLLVRPPAQIVGDVASLSLGPYAGTAKVRARLQQADWHGAERELMTVPGSVEKTYLSARLAVDRGKSGAAVILEKLLRQADHDSKRALRAEILALLGRLSFEKGAAAKAVNYLDEAVQLYPGLAEAQLYLGLATLERGDRDRARAALTAATKLPPRPIEASYYLGRLLSTEAPIEARVHLQRYLEQAPKGPFAEDARLLMRGK